MISESRCFSASTAQASAARASSSHSAPSARRDDEHDRGVDDVLARRAAVEVRGCVLADPLAQRAQQPRDRCAVLGGRTRELLEIESLRVTRRREFLGSGGGRHAAADERAGQRELDIEHRLNDRAVTQRVLYRVFTGYAREQHWRS